MGKSEQRQKFGRAADSLLRPLPEARTALALTLSLILAATQAAAQQAETPTAAPEIVVTPPPSEPATPPPAEPEPKAAEPVAPESPPQERPPSEAARERAPEPPPQAQPVTPPAAAPEAAAGAPPAAAGTAAEPLIVETPMPVAVPQPVSEEGGTSWLWLLALLPLAALVGLAWLWRRRRRIENGWRSDYHEDYVPAEDFGPEPTTDAPMPVSAAPAAAVSTGEDRSEEASPSEATAPMVQEAEVEAVEGPGLGTERAILSDEVSETLGDGSDGGDIAGAAASEAPDSPAPDRPLLELMMRPLRAGTTEEEARVEFELTIGNAGKVEAENVRISSWMFAAGSVQANSMERMLMDPPPETTLSQVTIPSGGGARIRTSIAMPRSTLSDSVLPVVVADARYALPGGGQSRISASFAIGRLTDGDLEPFSVDEPAGLEEGIGWRLYGQVYSA
jgi:outer membrane biosynthesis protein TonB